MQSRCEFANYRKNWLTRAQGLVQDGHFLIEQRTRALAGWLFQFNGTGGIWRRETIEAVGGWSDYSLCEDLDLTVRAALGGWHGIFVTRAADSGPGAGGAARLSPPAAALVERLRAGRAEDRCCRCGARPGR